MWVVLPNLGGWAVGIADTNAALSVFLQVRETNAEVTRAGKGITIMQRRAMTNKLILVCTCHVSPYVGRLPVFPPRTTISFQHRDSQYELAPLVR